MADNAVFIGQSEKREELFLPVANRHGIITGATGTGKTVTLQIMAERPEVTSWELVEACYQNVDRRLWRAADRVVQTHLKKLEKEGRIKVYAGVPKKADPNEVSKLAEEEHERLEILRKADEIRDQMKRRTVMLQENGPASEWEEQPRYELIRR